MFKEWPMMLLPTKYSWQKRALGDKAPRVVFTHTSFFFHSDENLYGKKLLLVHKQK